MLFFPWMIIIPYTTSYHTRRTGFVSAVCWSNIVIGYYVHCSTLVWWRYFIALMKYVFYKCCHQSNSLTGYLETQKLGMFIVVIPPTLLTSLFSLKHILPFVFYYLLILIFKILFAKIISCRVLLHYIRTVRLHIVRSIVYMPGALSQHLRPYRNKQTLKSSDGAV
jgi:hypothetical protein